MVLVVTPPSALCPLLGHRKQSPIFWISWPEIFSRRWLPVGKEGLQGVLSFSGQGLGGQKLTLSLSENPWHASLPRDLWRSLYKQPIRGQDWVPSFQSQPSIFLVSSSLTLNGRSRADLDSDPQPKFPPLHFLFNRWTPDTEMLIQGNVPSSADVTPVSPHSSCLLHSSALRSVFTLNLELEAALEIFQIGENEEEIASFARLVPTVITSSCYLHLDLKEKKDFKILQV